MDKIFQNKIKEGMFLMIDTTADAYYASSGDNVEGAYDPEMEKILDKMLENDENITARGVIRHHSTLKAASSITRNQARSTLLAKYQMRQEEFRGWRKRLAKRSKGGAAMDMAGKDIRIVELERQVELLIASHVAMIRAVGELGGFSKWAKFYDRFKNVRDDLASMGALSEASISSINCNTQGSL
jgi:hypothetical protein